jgi:hypothetical protein
VESIESGLVQELQQALSKLSEQTEADSKKNNQQVQKDEHWDWGKVGKVAGLAVLGGAAVGLTGGLAAPLIGGAIGTTFLGLSGAVATSAGLAFIGGGSLAAGGLGMAGGTAIVYTALGLGGAGVAGWKAAHLHGQIKEWDVSYVGGQGLHVQIGISGFLQQNHEHTSLWSPLVRCCPKSSNYALIWESKAQKDLGKLLLSLGGKGVCAGGMVNAALGAAKKAASVAALPLAALAALSVIDNPWSVAKGRADQAGELLGDYIADNQFGGLPVTLIGYSLGAQVVLAALDRLAQRQETGKIYNVYFLAGAISQDDPRLKALDQVVAGKVIDFYSEKDLVLAYIYRTAELLSQPIGANPLNHKNVINLDVTETVGGHLDYLKKLDLILSKAQNCSIYPEASPDQSGTQPSTQPQSTQPHSTQPLIKTLIKQLNQVPGMMEANRADFVQATVHLNFKNGVTLRTWKNIAGVDHVFVGDEKGDCVYGGYVGWIHSTVWQMHWPNYKRICKMILFKAWWIE